MDVNNEALMTAIEMSHCKWPQLLSIYFLLTLPSTTITGIPIGNPSCVPGALVLDGSPMRGKQSSRWSRDFGKLTNSGSGLNERQGASGSLSEALAMEGIEIQSQDFKKCVLEGFLEALFPCALREDLLIVSLILSKGIGRNKVCSSRRGDEVSVLPESSPREILSKVRNLYNLPTIGQEPQSTKTSPVLCLIGVRVLRQVREWNDFLYSPIDITYSHTIGIQKIPSKIPKEGVMTGKIRAKAVASVAKLMKTP